MHSRSILLFFDYLIVVFPSCTCHLAILPSLLDSGIQSLLAHTDPPPATNPFHPARCLSNIFFLLSFWIKAQGYLICIINTIQSSVKYVLISNHSTLPNQKNSPKQLAMLSNNWSLLLQTSQNQKIHRHG